MADHSHVIEALENRWMRAWIGADSKTLKALTSRKFRLVVGSKPSVLLDARSWLEAAKGRFTCTGYRFGDIYSRDLGALTVFATQLELRASLDGQDWSGQLWVTDLWHKSSVQRRWTMVERHMARSEENTAIPQAVRSLQLWR